MSNEFVSTKCRGFKQSGCRARVTREPGFFGWQILNLSRIGGNAKSNGETYGPLGSPIGIYDVDTLPPFNGPYFIWQDFSLDDPRNGSDFIVPTTAQLKTDGYIHDTWFSQAVNVQPPTYTQSFGFPRPQVFREGFSDYPRLHKSTSPLGIFNSDSIGSGFKVRKGVMCIAQGWTYDSQTWNSVNFFPAGIETDQWQFLKLYDKIGGTITKHAFINDKGQVPSSIAYYQMPDFSGMLPPPHHVEEYFPAAGDPPRVFKPDDFTYSNFHYSGMFPYPRNLTTRGTMEVMIFWFYLHQGDLPSFPLAFNTATDFFFVG